MTVDRRRRRRLALAGIAVVAALVAVGAAVLHRDDRAAADDPCQAPRTAPPAELALMPPGLSFETVGPVTDVRRNERQVWVHAVTTKPLEEVTVLIQDAVTAAGYRPAGMDNEGFEAEVFFTTGSYAAGQARVRQFGCEGRWDVDLVLLDRDAVPSGTQTPTVP